MRKDLASGELYGLVNSKGLDSLLADHAYNNDLRLATPDSTGSPKSSETNTKSLSPMPTRSTWVWTWTLRLS